MIDRREVLATTAALPLLAAARGQQPMEHGINPSFHGPSSVALVFADAMFRARDGRIQPSSTRIFSDVEMPTGVWIIEWSGSGQVRLEGEAAELERRAGWARYSIPRNDRPLFVSWTGDATNIRVWMPNHAGKLWWTPFVAWLRNLSPVTLRTLDWTRVNEGLHPRDPRSQWVVEPVLQVDLANRLGCGLHYQVPHDASAEWLTETFTALRALRGELTLEVSNEMWNASFPVYRWLDSQPGRHVEAAAREIDRVFALADQHLPTARHYVGGHLQNPWYLETLLGLVQTRVDAAGCATYMHPRKAFTDGELLAHSAVSSVEGIRANLQEHRRITTARGLRLEVYESGFHPDPMCAAPVIQTARRSATLAIGYLALNALHEECGVDRVIHYSLATQDDIGTSSFGLYRRMPAQGEPAPPAAVAVAELMGA